MRARARSARRATQHFAAKITPRRLASSQRALRCARPRAHVLPPAPGRRARPPASAAPAGPVVLRTHLEPFSMLHRAGAARGRGYGRASGGVAARHLVQGLGARGRDGGGDWCAATRALQQPRGRRRACVCSAARSGGRRYERGQGGVRKSGVAGRDVRSGGCAGALRRRPGSAARAVGVHQCRGALAWRRVTGVPGAAVGISRAHGGGVGGVRQCGARCGAGGAALRLLALFIANAV